MEEDIPGKVHKIPNVSSCKYSCLPNEYGTLRGGAKRTSSTVGADIDVPVETDFVLSKN